MLPPMPSPSALRFAVAAAIVAPLAFWMFGTGCGPDQTYIWLCLNPVTGKEDGMIYDSNHYVNGVLDPCHCFDPCGPSNECPIVVLDAGSPSAPGCDAGADDAGDGGP